MFVQKVGPRRSSIQEGGAREIGGDDMPDDAAEGKRHQSRRGLTKYVLAWVRNK